MYLLVLLLADDVSRAASQAVQEIGTEVSWASHSLSHQPGSAIQGSVERDPWFGLSASLTAPCRPNPQQSSCMEE